MTATLASMEEGTEQLLRDREDDARLAALMAEGRSEALAALYDRHGSTCYRVALRVTANPAIAEEVVQEAFLALWRTKGYREQAGTLRAYLISLVHHKAVDAVRRETSLSRRQATYERRAQADGAGRDTPEAEVLRELRDGEIRAALMALPDGQREALVLAYFGGYSQREIAELTSLPLGTVKTRTFAALRRLQGRLGGSEEASWEGSR
jgi:RNA polymerase sigma factor (sigma-70 family)